MLDNGSVKEIDITKLKIRPNYFDCSSVDGNMLDEVISFHNINYYYKYNKN